MKKFYNIFLKLIHNLFLRIHHNYYKVFLPKAQWKSLCEKVVNSSIVMEKFFCSWDIPNDYLKLIVPVYDDCKSITEQNGEQIKCPMTIGNNKPVENCSFIAWFEDYFPSIYSLCVCPWTHTRLCVWYLDSMQEVGCQSSHAGLLVQKAKPEEPPTTLSHRTFFKMTSKRMSFF